MKPTPIAPDYTSFLTEVKGRIQTARLQAGRAVNRELVADEAGTPVSADDEIALLPPLCGA